jgi:hypothetical protein
MAQVTMKSWRYGMKKISLTKLQTELLNIPLKDAHENVNKLLDDIEVILDIEDLNLALDFIKRAEEIGVNCILN